MTARERIAWAYTMGEKDMTRREIEAMQKEIEAANAHRRAAGLKRLYLCDPRKNRECGKESCAYKGRRSFASWCYLTMKEECRADSIEDLVGYRF